MWTVSQSPPIIPLMSNATNATALPFGVLPASTPHLALKAARAEHTKALAEMGRVAVLVRRALDRGEETINPTLGAKVRAAQARLATAKAAHNAAAQALGLTL